MRIGIDISQLAYEATGVANFLKQLVEHLIEEDKGNEYVLFYASLRKPLSFPKLWSRGKRVTIENFPKSEVKSVTINEFRLPPTLLDILWNRLHIFPIEKLIGPVDVFISSDWTQPPSKAKKVTILYDLIVYKHPKETANKIVNVHKRRLKWVKKEVDKVICISEATKKDAIKLLGIDEAKLAVITPGI